MTTQREPDTSAGRWIFTAEAISKHYSKPGERESLFTVVNTAMQVAENYGRECSLADAAGHAAPVTPPVEGLETTAKDRRETLIALAGIAGPDVAWDRAIIRDFDREHIRADAEHDRAEGLAKEVERLKGINSDLVRNHNTLLVDGARWEARANAAEAKLAVYEAPIGDGGATYYTEGKDAEWFEGLDDLKAAEELTKAAQDLNDTDLGDALDKWLPHNAMLSNSADRIRRLSAAHAECKGENTKLREAARRAENWFAAFGFNQHGIAVKDDFEDHEEIRSELRAAIAPASGEKAT